MDPTYLLTWFFYKLPIVYHIALIFLFLSTIVFRKTSPLFRYSTYYIVSVNLAFIFFLPITYDGIRQYIFLLPFYSILLVEALLKIKDTKYKDISQKNYTIKKAILLSIIMGMILGIIFVLISNRLKKW